MREKLHYEEWCWPWCSSLKKMLQERCRNGARKLSVESTRKQIMICMLHVFLLRMLRVVASSDPRERCLAPHSIMDTFAQAAHGGVLLISYVPTLDLFFSFFLREPSKLFDSLPSRILCCSHLEDLVRTCIHQICAALRSFAMYFRRSGISTRCTKGTAGLAEASGAQSRKRKRGTRQRTKETSKKHREKDQDQIHQSTVDPCRSKAHINS